VLVPCSSESSAATAKAVGLYGQSPVCLGVTRAYKPITQYRLPMIMTEHYQDHRTTAKCASFLRIDNCVTREASGPVERVVNTQAPLE
jgi:hypothetical protein